MYKFCTNVEFKSYQTNYLMLLYFYKMLSIRYINGLFDKIDTVCDTHFFMAKCLSAILSVFVLFSSLYRAVTFLS